MSEEIVFTKEQQEFVDKKIGVARVKAREAARAEFEAKSAKAKEDSAQTALAAEQKWKELAELHQARVKELEPLEGQVQAYNELIADMLKDKVKELGNEAKKAIAGLPDTMTVIEKLDWLNKNEGLFQAVGDGVGTPRRPQQQAKTERDKITISKYPIRL